MSLLDKLKGLKNFVDDNTNRKILKNWQAVEIRFRKSSQFRDVLKKNENGLNYVVKSPVLTLSSLTGFLCSSRIKVGSKEIHDLYKKMGFRDEEANHSRKVAALRAIIQSNSRHPEKIALIQSELQELLKVVENSVTLEELQNQIFATDPEERKKQLDEIKNQKGAQVSAMMDQKMKKDEAKEKADQRRRQAIESFEKNVLEIQSLRGTQFNESRSRQFEEVIEFCIVTCFKMRKGEIVKVSHELVDLLGLESFPQMAYQFLDFGHSTTVEVPLEEYDAASKAKLDEIQKYIVENQQKKAIFRRIKFPAVFERMPLLQLLRETVAYCKGLNGLSYRDVVEMLQCYSAVRIQAVFRGHDKKTRYFTARRKWRKIFRKIKLEVFTCWRDHVNYRLALKKYCLRKIVAWRYYKRCNDVIRDRFRICFWPFYVWRRYIIKSLTAKNKAKFLVTRVWPTYLQLTIFRAWKKYSLLKAKLHRLTALFIKRQQKRRLVIFIQWMRSYARKRKILRRCWITGGIDKLKKLLFIRKSTPFQIWQAYVYYRKVIRARAARYGPLYRNQLITAEHRPAPIKHKMKSALIAERIQRDYEETRLRELVLKLEKKDESKKERLASGDSHSRGGNDSHDSRESRTSRGSRSSRGSLDSVDSYQEKLRVQEEIEIILDNASKRHRLPSEFTRKYRSDFCWKSDKPDYDIESDDDDRNAPLPQNMVEKYSSSMDDFPDPIDIKHILWLDNFVLKKVRNMAASFRKVENWAALEHALRFHRQGKRAFQNLLIHAKVTRNARLSQKAYNFKIKRLVFAAFLRWMMRDGRQPHQSSNPRIVIAHQSVGEKLKEMVRFNRWEKMLRRRDLTVKIRRHMSASDDQSLGQEESDFICDKETRKKALRAKEIKRMRKWAGTDDLEDNQPVPIKTALALMVETTSETTNAVTSARSAITEASGLTNVTSDTTANPDVKPGSNWDVLSDQTSLTNIDTITVVTPKNDDISESDENTKSARRITRKASVRRRSSNVSEVTASTISQLTNKSRRMSGSVSTTPKPLLKTKTPKSKGKGRKKNFNVSDMASGMDILPKPDEPFKPPNILEWDREDRASDLNLAEQLIAHGKSIRITSLAVEKESCYLTETMNRQIELKNTIMEEVMNAETALTESAVQEELKYSKTFKMHIAGVLVDCLYNIHQQVIASIARQRMKKYFRLIRLPMLYKRSISMYRCKRLYNWLRICKRLISLNRLAPRYYSYRKMWVTFNRWLKLLEYQTTATPGLIIHVKNRVQRFLRFDNYLASNGFIKVIYHNSKRLSKATSTMSALFLRWSMFNEERRLFRILADNCTDYFKLSTLQKCFYAIKHNMSSAASKKLRDESQFFLLKRVKCNIEQITKIFLSKRKRTVFTFIRKYNIKYSLLMQKNAKTSLSFKKFLNNLQWEINMRMEILQRLLVEHFENRGTQTFTDIVTPSKLKNSKIPDIMLQIEGRRFCDPPNESASAYDEEFKDMVVPIFKKESYREEMTLPGGFRFAKLRLNFHEYSGVVGWQIVWSADEARDIVSPKRGNWVGGAATIEEVTIPKGDFVIGVEYSHEGSAITGIRLKYFMNGWSKFYGHKSSLSSQTVYLGAEMAPRLGFEDDYDPGKGDEAKDPAFPRNYVIGFAGVEGIQRATCMSIVVRKVKSQHIFSYLWVQDALDGKIESLSGEDLNDSVINKGVDGGLIPSHIESNQMDAFIGDESVTLGSLPPIGERKIKSRTGTTSSRKSANSVNLYESRESTAVDHRSSMDSLFPTVRGDDSSRESRNRHLIVKTANGGFIEEALLKSESQFLDCLRMRTIEIQVAEERAVAFLRRVWSSKSIREDPKLNKLTSFTIVSSLSKWLFEAISHRLDRLCRTEEEGKKLLAEASNKRRSANISEYRSGFFLSEAATLEKSVQIWTGKSLLSPHERLLRQNHKAKIRQIKESSLEALRIAKQLRKEAIELERIGQTLLPRIQLSKTVMLNFIKKIAASRQKESLLRVIDMTTIKKLVTGKADDDTGIPDDSLNILKSNLKYSKSKSNFIPKSLDDDFDDNMIKSRPKRYSTTDLLGKLPLLLSSSSSDTNTNTDRNRHKTFRKRVGMNATQYLSKSNLNHYQDLIKQSSLQTIDFTRFENVHEKFHQTFS